MRNKKGAVLILTFIVMATLAAITAAFLSLTSIQTKGSGYDIVSHKTLWLADAGLQKAFYTLKNDVNYQNNPTPLSGSLGDGTYLVSVVKNNSIYTFSSIGTVGVMNRKITHSMALTSSVLVRSIHADGSNLDFQNSNGTVNGNVSCHVQVVNYGNMVINGTVTDGFPMINPAIDYDYYKTLAQAQSKYYTTDLTFQNGTFTGVYYTTKKVTIGDNAVINATIIAIGNIDFNNSANNIQINPANNYPALATKGQINSTGVGNPKVGLQNSTVNGLIIAEQNITFDYLINTTFSGTVLASSNISMKYGSNFTLNYNENIFAPMPPGFSYTASGTTAVISQKDWNEIVPAV
ncbi:MAG: hypothetical protein PHO42_02605 [Candidatus Omnitrophica bacterium]|nr:hypothetical protein [Candidatus Omnitrophota bacterium]